MNVEINLNCENCLYGRKVGGGKWSCVSEKRRIDRLPLVNDLNKPFKCDYGEFYKHPLRGE